MLEITMSGNKTLERQLRDMTRAGQRGTVRRAARAGARAVAMRARQLAPRSQVPRHPKGHAYKMIKWWETDSWPDRATFAVGAQGWGWYLWLHEVGTSKFAAQPHLRPALEEQRGHVADEMGVVFKEAIIQAVERAKARR